MRMVLAVIGFDAGGNADLFDPAPQALQGDVGFHARPQRVRAATAGENTGARKRHPEAGEGGSAQALGQLVRQMGVDLTDITQRNMQLVVILPPHRIDALHQVDQRVADRCGRADADEKAVVHGSGLQDGRGQSAAFGGKSRGR